ncbi:MAG: aminoglycoside phosphotransferase family protein [Nocardioidaceae bacterium]
MSTIVEGVRDRRRLLPPDPRARFAAAANGDVVRRGIGSTALATVSAGDPLPRRMVHQALLGRGTGGRPGEHRRITHGDLHYENVLAADREPWLVIDPKPMSGDPTTNPPRCCGTAGTSLVASGDIRGGIRRRFHTLVDAAGLDEDRARDWVVVRSIINAHWSIEDAEGAGRDLNAERACLDHAMRHHGEGWSRTEAQPEGNSPQQPIARC